MNKTRREVFSEQCKVCMFERLHHVICNRPPLDEEIGRGCIHHIKREEKQDGGSEHRRRKTTR